MKSFKDLQIWQQAVELTVDVYKEIEKFPNTEKFGLSSQLSRCVNSIGANIAESWGRYHIKDKLNFLYHARGSLVETEHHIIVSNKLGYISDKRLKAFTEQITDLRVKLNNYISRLRK